MFSNNLLIAAGISSAAAAVIYVLWGPSQRTKKSGLCKGLENLGNTCFMNVVLQAWASTPSVVSWLRDFLARNPSHPDSSCLARPLLHTLNIVNNKEEDYNDVHSPASIIGALRAKRWIISHDQQDAHEFFNVLTSTLDEEGAKFQSTVPLFDFKSLENDSIQYQSPSDAMSRTGGLLPVLPDRESENPFRMLVASQLECVECMYRHPVRYDLTDSLSLSFTRRAWHSIKLEVMLQKFISPEIVQDVECPGCKKIKAHNHSTELPSAPSKASNLVLDLNPKSSCLKRLTVGKLPQCLCLHMQRTQWLDSGIPYKKFEHVVFPEMLNLEDYVYTNCENFGRRGLVGGKTLFGNTTIPIPTLPGAQSPNANPVNLLRALNYDSRISAQGLCPYSNQQGNPMVTLGSGPQSDINHNSPKAQDYMYRLTAVVTHLGDVFSGHFVTYRRGTKVKAGEKYSNQWLCTSDHAVKEVTFEEVLGTEAYMLFYERV